MQKHSTTARQRHSSTTSKRASVWSAKKAATLRKAVKMPPAGYCNCDCGGK